MDTRLGGWRRLLSLAALVMGLFSSLPVGRMQAQPGSGDSAPQVFSVTLTLQPLASPSPQFARSCSQSDERSAIEGIRYQFIVSPSSQTPTLQVLPAEFAEPVDAEGGSAALLVDGADLTFDAISVVIGTRSLKLSGGQIRVRPAQGAGSTAGLDVRRVHLRLETVTGDVIRACDADATGTGTPDQMSPVARFAIPCDDSRPDQCALLPDGTLTLAFSKSVQFGDVSARLSATDQDGAMLPILPMPAPGPAGYLYRFRAAWPLGQQVTVRLAAGVRDLAGNASARIVERNLSVVPDPGDLDAAGNSGFERGGLMGYTVRVWSSLAFLANPPVGDPSAFGQTTASPPDVVRDFRGVTPTEGRSMLAAGSLTNCSFTDFVLATRFLVPAGVTQIVLDGKAILPANQGGRSGVILSASVAGSAGIESMDQQWPSREALADLDGETLQSDWQQMRLSVSRFSDSQVTLILRLQPFGILGPPPFCLAGVLLLDNLRFE